MQKFLEGLGTEQFFSPAKTSFPGVPAYVLQHSSFLTLSQILAARRALKRELTEPAQALCTTCTDVQSHLPVMKRVKAPQSNEH